MDVEVRRLYDPEVEDLILQLVATELGRQRLDARHEQGRYSDQVNGARDGPASAKLYAGPHDADSSSISDRASPHSCSS